MSGPSAVALTLTPAQEIMLTSLLRQATCPQNRAQRAKIILALHAEKNVTRVSRHLGLTRIPVQLWRDRWIAAHPRLVAVEDDPPVLAHTICAVLDDAYRSGTPATFSAEQLTQIMVLACEPPPEAISHWTPQELALAAIQRGIVSAISARTVGRFLKREPTQTASLPILAQPDNS